MEHFSYKGGSSMHGRTHVEMLKRRAGLGYIDKQLWVISIIILFMPIRN